MNVKFDSFMPRKHVRRALPANVDVKRECAPILRIEEEFGPWLMREGLLFESRHLRTEFAPFLKDVAVDTRAEGSRNAAIELRQRNDTAESA